MILPNCQALPGVHQFTRRSGMQIFRNGIALAYEEAGRGEPPLLLAHSWGLERSSLQPVFDFARRSRRVVAVDLRGFGQSAAPEQAYTIESQSDDLAFISEQLGLEQTVVVGHSMGGSVALDFAARYPARVSAAVILEAMIVAPESVLAGLRPLLDGVRSPFYRDVVTRMIHYLTGRDFPAAARARFLQSIMACPQHVLVAALEGILSFDSASAAQRVQCPLFYIGTETTYADLDRLRACCPQLVTGQLVGCGHYFPIEAADQLNALLARWLGLEAA
jgi:pimeloyl-ACP methyl ester carboxylesterase